MRTQDEIQRRLAAIEKKAQTEIGWRLKRAPVMETESDTLRWVLGEEIPLVAKAAHRRLLEG